ncbi:MAG: hypothetical protein JO020_23055 [Chloroflexi bacterium]|nr:hypothetical protein [Chloroflexota bacterium]
MGIVEPYMSVGATWWLENVSPWHFGGTGADPGPLAQPAADVPDYASLGLD